MNIVSVLLLFAGPLIFLSWTLRFKGQLAIISAAPAAILLLAVLALNSDPTISFIHAGVACPGNGTECSILQDDVPYPIQPSVMTILNVLTMAGIFSVIFVAFRRLTRPMNKNRDEE